MERTRLDELIAITKALADESRVRIVGALLAGELCVCQIVELLELAPSTVSKHLALLRSAGLVEVRKDGRWAYYSLAGRRASRTVRRALALVEQALAGDPRRAADSSRLERILKLDPEVLCCRQRTSMAATSARAAASSSSVRATRRAVSSRKRS